jgi:pilin
MNRRLIVLILFALVLFWKFVLFPSKLELSDRAKVLQGISLARPYKEAIVNYWKSKTEFPGKEDWQSESLISVEILDKSLLESIVVGEEAPGSISLLYTSRKDLNAPAYIEGKKVVLTPSAKGGEVIWSCKGTLPEELLPVPCQ